MSIKNIFFTVTHTKNSSLKSRARGPHPAFLVYSYFSLLSSTWLLTFFTLTAAKKQPRYIGNISFMSDMIVGVIKYVAQTSKSILLATYSCPQLTFLQLILIDYGVSISRCVVGENGGFNIKIPFLQLTIQTRAFLPQRLV